MDNTLWKIEDEYEFDLDFIDEILSDAQSFKKSELKDEFRK